MPAIVLVIETPWIDDSRFWGYWPVDVRVQGTREGPETPGHRMARILQCVTDDDRP